MRSKGAVEQPWFFKCRLFHCSWLSPLCLVPLRTSHYIFAVYSYNTFYIPFQSISSLNIHFFMLLFSTRPHSTVRTNWVNTYKALGIVSTSHIVSTLHISHYLFQFLILCQLFTGRSVFEHKFGMFFLLHHNLTWSDCKNSGNRILKNNFGISSKLIILTSIQETYLWKVKNIMSRNRNH